MHPGGNGRLSAASGREGDDGWTTPAGLALHTVLEVPLVAACPEHHPLAAAQVAARPGDAHRGNERPGNALPVAALAGHALVSTPPGTGMRTALERALAAAGASAVVGVEAAAPPQLAELAAHGLGVAVLPDPGAVPGLRVRPLTGPVPLVRIALAWPGERPAEPATAALLSHLRTAYPGPAAATARQASGLANAPAAPAPSPTCRSAAAPSRTSRSSGK